MTAADPDALHALTRLVLDDPADDGPRLVYADWCEEHGDTSRAEFIRVQVESARLGAEADHGECDCDRCTRYDTLLRRERELLEGGPIGDVNWWRWAGPEVQALIPDGAEYTDHVTFRRGFVGAVTCTVVAWCGGVCERCGGNGSQGAQSSDGIGGQWASFACNACDGTCRTKGVGPACVAAQPIERVTLVGKRPTCEGERRPHWSDEGDDYECNVSMALLELMPLQFGDAKTCRYFDTEAAALDAISHAAIALVRNQAVAEGLVPRDLWEVVTG